MLQHVSVLLHHLQGAFILHIMYIKIKKTSYLYGIDK